MLPIRKLSGSQSDGGRDRYTSEPPRPGQEGASTPPPTGQALARAAAEIISGLHQAKEELAQELEVNLRQLRAVLEETQRIAHQMEAVLNEVRGQPDARDDEEDKGRSDRSPDRRPEGRRGRDEPRTQQESGKRREGAAGGRSRQAGSPAESLPPARLQLRRKPPWEAPPDDAPRSPEPRERWEPPVSTKEGADGWDPPVGWEPPEEAGDPWADEEDW